MTRAPLLELAGIHKRFGDVVAIDGASFVLRPGTIHALLGENGAGKTTLMRIAYGMIRPDGGEMRTRGVVRVFSSPSDAVREGIGMVHQHFTLVPSMTVAENLALGRRGLIHRAEMVSRVLDTARRTGFPLDPDARIESLSVGAQQRVEIAKAVARDPEILILDEPTAVLSPSETGELMLWLKEFAQAGHAVVLITHKLGEALAVSDDITVMRRGRVVLTGSARDVRRDDLTSAMLGEQLAEPESRGAAPHRTAPGHAPVFAAHDMTIVDEAGRVRIRASNFAIYGGEIVGIAAIEGSGQQELLRAMAGRIDITAGTLVRPDSVGYIPEDRHRDGVMLDRSLTENVALRGAGDRGGTLDWNWWRAFTESLMTGFDVRAPDADVPIRSLSGGNQQKLVLAREIGPPDASLHGAGIVADNATRGLDIRAAAEVQQRLREVAAGGAAVVLYASDIDDMLPLVSRVLVLRDAVLREVPVNRDAIGRAMIGAEG